jgi:hypothetical protein
MDAGEYWVTIIVTSGDGAFLWGSDIDAEEIEVTSDLLNRRRLPETVSFEDVSLSLTGGADRGMVRLDFTPVGPTEKMLAHLVNDAGSRLTVFFDPLTGTSGILEGYAESLGRQALGWKTGLQ